MRLPLIGASGTGAFAPVPTGFAYSVKTMRALRRNGRRGCRNASSYMKLCESGTCAVQQFCTAGWGVVLSRFDQPK